MRLRSKTACVLVVTMCILVAWQINISKWYSNATLGLTSNDVAVGNAPLQFLRNSKGSLGAGTLMSLDDLRKKSLKSDISAPVHGFKFTRTDTRQDDLEPQITHEIKRFEKKLSNFRTNLVTNLTTRYVFENSHPEKADGSYNYFNADELAQPQSRTLKVIVMPHSHVDPGWLKTFEGYYREQTHAILDNIVKKLTQYPDMRFIWAETSFLDLWWWDQTREVQNTFRGLVNQGRIEIVTGGWVMPDEASTHYYAIIDQLIEGHRWIKDNLNTEPHIHWSVDPFGHSGTIPYLWSLAGFDSMVIGRIHVMVKRYLGAKKFLEFVWGQTWDKYGEHDMFCHMMPYFTYVPGDSCGPDSSICTRFDFTRKPPFLNKGEMSEMLLEAEAKVLYDQFRKKASIYSYDTILVPLGGDFDWTSEHTWDIRHSAYNMLFEFMNNRSEWNIDVKFGTLSDYFAIVNERREQNRSNDVPLITGDFFPYAERKTDYWTGYYTSRPLDKYLGRKLQASLIAADIANVLAGAYAKQRQLQYDHVSQYTLLQKARRHLALFQHHDAITGTSEPPVVADYEQKLYSGLELTANVLVAAVTSLISKADVPQALVLLNSTSILGNSSKAQTILFYNPLYRHRHQTLAFYVENLDVDIQCGKQHIPIQLTALTDASGRKKNQVMTHLKLAPLSMLKCVIASRVNPQYVPIHEMPPIRSTHSKVVLENACMIINIDSKSGMLQRIYDKSKDLDILVKLEFVQYQAGSRDGAYLFNPASEANVIAPMTGHDNNIEVKRGRLASTVQITHTLFTHVITLLNSTDQGECGVIQIDNMVNIGRTQNMEIAMRFKTEIQNKDIFYSDQNSIEIVEHKRIQALPLAGNVKPMTSMASIQDSKVRFNIHSSQPHGVASHNEGCLEVMLDRTMVFNDGKGLRGGINQNPPVPSHFILTLHDTSQVDIGNSALPSLNDIHINDALQNPIIIMTDKSTRKYNDLFEPVKSILPDDVTLLSMRSLILNASEQSGTAFIVHKRRYEMERYPQLSKNLPISPSFIVLQDMFKDITIANATKMYLNFVREKGPIAIDSQLTLSEVDLLSLYLTW